MIHRPRQLKKGEERLNALIAEYLKSVETDA